MALSRRGFLMGSMALALAGCKGGEDGPNERLGMLFEGFDELGRDDALHVMRPFDVDDHPVVYFGAAREVYEGCAADMPVLQQVLTEGAPKKNFVPVLVMPPMHPDDGDRSFLDEFRVLQAAIPSARVLTHEDPAFLRAFSIRNGGAYNIDAGGYVEGHSRNLHIYRPDASQMLFDRNYGDRSGRMNAEGFAMAVYSGRFEGVIDENCHVDQELRTRLEFDCL